MRVTVTKDDGRALEWVLGVPEDFMDSALIGAKVVNDSVTVRKDGSIDVDKSVQYLNIPVKNIDVSMSVDVGEPKLMVPTPTKITTSAAPHTPLSVRSDPGKLPSFWQFLWGSWCW